jgi:hypothetical protein
MNVWIFQSAVSELANSAWRPLISCSKHSQANRRSHIGVVVAMIGKSASSRKRMTKGATNGDGPAIKRRPVVTGDRMGHCEPDCRAKWDVQFHLYYSWHVCVSLRNSSVYEGDDHCAVAQVFRSAFLPLSTPVIRGKPRQWLLPSRRLPSKSARSARDPP